MIDTDKYKEHTPAPWVIEEGDMEYGETDTIITVAPPMNFVVANGIMRQDAQLIADAPKLLAEVKRAYQLIVDAAWQLHWNVGTIASSAHLSSKEWDEEIYAPAQAWRKQVQEILDASGEGCPWKESEEE